MASDFNKISTFDISSLRKLSKGDFRFQAGMLRGKAKV